MRRPPPPWIRQVGCLLGLVVVPLALGCGSSADTPAAAGGEPSADAGGEASPDVGTPDAAADADADASASDVSASDVDDSGEAEGSADADGGKPGKCQSDADCAASSLGKVCDVGTGACVECAIANDACPAGEYCGPAITCVPGCKTTSDCNASDAGVGEAGAGDAGALTCDPGTHQCVGCLADADCPAGTLCDSPSHACVPGCTQQHACQSGKGCCAGSCSDLQKDVANCGTCSSACPAPAHGKPGCASGQCGVATCDPGFADCDGNASNGCESDTTSDTAHCGGCGLACQVANGTPACVGSICQIAACASLFGDCDGQYGDGCETDLSANVQNCGTCAHVCQASNDVPACSGGVCQVGTCASLWGDCNLGAADGCERNLANDSTNCGACNYACNVPHATAQCSVGVCGILACSAPFLDCDGFDTNGCEVDPGTDAANCGGCGQKCAFPNATSACVTGNCSIAACLSGYANCNSQAADGCETDLATDTQHCGTCATTCTVANGVPACATGSCKIQTCNPGFRDCDGAYANGCEVDGKTDVNNCGACGTACATPNGTPTCTGGSCGIASCAAGFANCNGAIPDGCETNLKTLANCGTCGVTCTTPNATASCATGTCTIGFCDTGRSDCDGNVANGCEIASATDVNNCGGCAKKCVVANGAPACSGGNCTVSTCAAGWADCDLSYATGCEINTRTDVNNCGGCNTQCLLPHVQTPACANGACAIVLCATGWADCNGIAADGCEASLTSAANCGACGAVCAPANATGVCGAGGCTVSTCNVGYSNCDGNVANGCEVATGSDVNNCGTCGHVCPSGSGTPNCTSGVCGVTACGSGLGNCDGNSVNGCETAIHDDVNNCGGCGVKCTAANGTPKCTGTTCGIASCNAGFADCNANATDGCEVNTHTTANCGSCGAVCSPANGTGTCGTGVCQVSSCNAGFGDCDGNAGNGCETNTSTSLSSCGSCGAACSGANALPSCSTGVCTLTCNGGFANCDGNAANGCEANLGSTSSCGACGKVCSANNGTPSCTAGNCAIACSAGFGDCNTNVVDGCETSLTSTSSCGACGVVCAPAHATGTCTTGSCLVAACAAGWADCDGNPANGCEVNTTGDVTHCGSCAKVCTGANGTPTCSGSTCGITCNSGWGNCDGNASNGCETDVTSSGTNCGGCGTTCASGSWCSASSCTACNTAGHCGASCTACSGTTPSCSGSACTCSGSSCGSGAYCNGTSCVSCNTTTYCGPSCIVCPGTAPNCGGPTVGCQCTTSPDSCGGTSSWCNAGTCTACGTGSCGNGRCDCGETSSSCSADCGQPCPTNKTLATWTSGDDGWSYNAGWWGRNAGGGYMTIGYTAGHSSSYSQDLTYTTSVDLSTCSSATLSFSLSLQDDVGYGSDKAQKLTVYCSGDAGASWTAMTPSAWPANQGTCSPSYCNGVPTSRSFGWTSQTDAIPPACRTANARFKFTAAGTTTWALQTEGWLVDNVKVN